MPATIFLSPLKKQDRTLPIPPEGRWHSQADFLAKYASDILVESKVGDRQLVHSVPTVFARPIQFFRALEDPAHPAHASAAGQWRGLLAVFALERWLDLSLSVQEIDLARLLESRPSTPEGGRGADLPLLSILRSQLPRPEREWRRWWLIRCRGQLLGATSPWSIVYTPAEYSCPPIIPWQHGGVLIDPIDYFDPERKGSRPRELALLSAWVERVREHETDRWGVADRGHLDGAMAMIKRELDAWAHDLARYREEGIAKLPQTQVEPLVREVPYQYFFRRIDAPQGRSAPSELLLATHSENKILALSRSALRPTRRVYGPVLVEQLDLAGMQGPSGPARWRTPAGREIPYPYLIAEEAFFPPKLAEVALSAQAYSPGARDFALPLTPLFLQYFGLEDLLQGTLMTELSANDQTVTVRLRLPISDGEPLFVERHYDRDTEVFAVDGGIPGFAIWPDIADDSWRHNFALMAQPRESNLVVSPITRRGTLLPANSSDGKEEPLRIWASGEPILGFSLAHRDETSGQLTPAGVILRSSLPRPEPRGLARWTVAVDFGTSSTHLLVKNGEHGGEGPLVFAPRKVLLTDASSANALAVERDVYPMEQVTPPFPTFLARSTATLVQGNEEALVREGDFLPYFKLDPTKLSLMIKDLKWPTHGAKHGEAPLRAYLTVLVRAITCEARAAGAREVGFQWSYPLALPAGVQRWLARFWGGISTVFSIPGELDVTAGLGTSESEALCRHLSEFGDLPILADSLSIAIDIGGGSSDIGFWSARKLLDQISLKIAGNDILVPLATHRQFLLGLAAVCAPGEDPEETVRLMTQNPEAQAAMINTLLVQARTANGEVFSGDPRLHPMPQALVVRLRAAEPPWSEVRSLIYLFVTGLSFYAGLHARKLFAERADKGAITLVFGGRASALLTWLERDLPIRDLLRATFLEGLTLEHDQFRSAVVEVFSPANWYDKDNPLKGEVVRGLLRGPLGGEAPTRPTKVMIGEKGWGYKAGEPLPWDTEVDAAQLAKLVPPANLDSGHAAHFLARVVPRYAQNLGLDEPGMLQLRLDAAKVQDNLRKSLADGQDVLQPVFAAELKALMERYLHIATGRES